MNPSEFIFSIKCGSKSGTAFLVSPDRAITAFHVIIQHDEHPIILIGPDEEIKCSLNPRIVDKYKRLDVALIDLGNPINLKGLPTLVQYNAIASGTPWGSRGFPQAKPIHGDNILDDGKSVVNQQLHVPQHGKFDLELEHPQKLGNYSGYSGAPLLINGAIAGIINHQLEVGGIAKEINALSLKYFGDLLLEEGIKVDKRNTTDFLHFKNILNQNWFRSQIDRTVLDLGVRYSQDLNVELEIARNFDYMVKNGAYETHLSVKFKEFISALQRYSIYLDQMSTSIKNADREIAFHNLKSTLNLVKEFLNDQLRSIIENPLDRIDQEILLQKVEDISNTSLGVRQLNLDTNKNRLIHVTDQLDEACIEFSRYIHSLAIRLANTPYLLLDGNAGTGKSHLLADVVSNQIKDGSPAILLLGQQFTSEKSPWIQITSEILQLDFNALDFLKTLNSIGEDSHSRILIAIDAINEGQGKIFWQNHIISFVTEFKQYPWLCLALSVRTTYLRAILPTGFDERRIMERLTHHGFEESEERAIQLFFDHYQIELPRTPLLNIEFTNPLFLKLYCEGLYRRNIHSVPVDYGGISSVINYVLENVDAKLGQPVNFDYSESAKVTGKIVNALIYFKKSNDLHFVPYDDACHLANNITATYTNKKGIIEHLIHEGILLKNNFWKSNGEQSGEGVILAYEKFDDHFTASMLLDTVINESNLNSVFRKDGELFYCINEGDFNQGLLEALSVKIPEKMGYELAELIDDEWKTTEPVMESFLDSLLWRRTDSIQANAKSYLENFIFRDLFAFQKFIDVAYCVAGDERHPFNAEYLHKKLIPLSLPIRDSKWTIFLVNFSSDHGIERMLSWISHMSFHKTISKESADLVATSLSWLFTTTDIELRNAATRSLVILLKNRMSSAETLIHKFSSVNDPYVFERILAAIYGAVLNTTDFSGLREVCKVIYENIFLVEEVYPNVLVRDYARNILEYAIYKQSFELDNPETIRPPYRSALPTDLPSNEATDALMITALDSPYYLSQNAIFHSMTTEYGRGIGGYGDFGRYTFQAALRCWGNIDSNLFSNYACQMILNKFGYDASLHGEFDRHLPQGTRQKNTIERIGKKYQWLSLYELVARIADNVASNQEYETERTEQFYQGPWENYLRTFDPTYIGPQSMEKIPHEPPTVEFSDWKGTIDEWLVSEDNLPDPIKMIDAGDFLVLETNYSWQSKDAFGFKDYNSENKSIWYQVRSYLVISEEQGPLIEWLKEQRFMGRWMPEGPENFSVFALENYWSPAYKYVAGDESEWRDITDRNKLWPNQEIIGKVICTTESHRAEGEQSTSFLAPTRKIFYGMNLDFSIIPGQFCKKNGVTLAFDPSMFGRDRSELLVEKKALQEFLTENGLSIFWTVLGEKQMLGGGMPTYKEWLEFSGIYQLVAGELQGQVNIIKRKKGDSY